MTNKLFDNSRIDEKIIDVILPKEVIYKEDKGEQIDSELRRGQIDGNSVYINKKMINTRYGQLFITPQIKIYFRAFTNNNSVLTIDMYNAEDLNLFKKFTIKSSNNNFSISDMKELCEEIKTLLNGDKKEKTKLLIELIRNKENLIFEETAQ